MSAPLVSIVLVTRNGGDTLRATLDAIARQRVDFSVEIVAVDSGSVDATLQLLERADARVVTIPPESFNHGLTRNLGIEHARGELIVLLVQDALPASDDWLARLTAPLRKDGYVAGAFCRQRPRSYATAITRLSQAGWVAFTDTSRHVRLTSAHELDQMAPQERLNTCAFDNVCSCVRRSVWRDIPFAETPIAEDLEWGRAALLAGFGLVYVADAVVLHSHERSARYEFARTYALHRRLFELFGLRTIPSARLAMRAITGSVRAHVECELRATREGGGTRGMSRAVTLAFAWPLGQYLGGLSAAKHWKPIQFKRV